MLLWIGIGVGLIYPTTHTIRVINEHKNSGAGYTSKTWRKNETIHYLLNNKPLDSECVLYSNDPDAMDFLANVTAKLSPRNTKGAAITVDIASLESKFPVEKKACLVWFNQTAWRKYLFTPDELKRVATLDKVAQFDDGTIYVVTKK